MIISSVPGVIEKSSAVGAFAVALSTSLNTNHLRLSLITSSAVIMGIGTGGFKANISPLIAEQYKITKLFVKTLKNGERVIVDPVLTTGRIYMVQFKSSYLSTPE